ncbi:MAG: alpha-galactosidase [Acholeplasmatales bacterium]|nr:alpha-galactosidase [Acholeplasmatales bacterium]
MNFILDFDKNDTNYKISSLDSQIVSFNESFKDKRYILSLNTKEEIKINSIKIEIDHKFLKSDLFFLNGYQSWTDSYLYKYEDKFKNIMKTPKFLLKAFAFDKYGDSHFKKYDKNVFHGYDLAYIKGEESFFIASLNYKKAFLIINFDKKNNKIILESDFNNIKVSGDVTLFDFIIGDDIKSTSDLYFSYFNIKKNDKIFGYTSWYNHYQNINEKLIMDSLDSLDSRFNLFQIDDGYEEYVGDWLNVDKNKFPNGLKPIVDKIHDKGFKASIWLAPFVVEEKSQIYNEHKDWVMKVDGNPVKCGSNWSGFYALDIYNSEVRDYIKKSLEHFMDLGFDFFKLDFLYASTVVKRDNKTRAQVSYESYEFLRSILKDKLILGCGAVISSAYNNFDYMRIGPDVSLKFDDVWFMRFFHRERISTKNTLRNTIYRSMLNGNVFYNDPDVFLLRDDNINLSIEQRKALIIINSLFGSVLMTSDNISYYDNNKKEILDFAFNIYNNATNKNYEKLGNNIKISFDLDNKKYEFLYDINKGILRGGKNGD